MAKKHVTTLIKTMLNDVDPFHKCYELIEEIFLFLSLALVSRGHCSSIILSIRLITFMFTNYHSPLRTPCMVDWMMDRVMRECGVTYSLIVVAVSADKVRQQLTFISFYNLFW